MPSARRLAPLLGLLFACGGNPSPEDPKPPSHDKGPSPPLSGTRRYVSYFGPTGVYYGADEIPEARAKGLDHFEIDFADDFPTEVREVAPSGRVDRVTKITRTQSRVEIARKNRFGVVEET